MENKKYNGAVFFDVDGTLVDETCGIYTPTDKTRKAINTLKSRGYLTAIATGRSKCYMADVDVDFDCYITCNGAVVEINNQVISRDVFSNDKKIELVDYLKSHNFGFNLETREKCYYGPTKLELMKKFLELFSINQNCFAPLEDSAAVPASKSMIMFDSLEQFELLKKKFANDFLIVKHVGYMSADINNIGITKAVGIKSVITKLNIPEENTFAFGDGMNDLDMLAAVAHGIAMTPHEDALLQVADYVTGSVSDEGIYNALNHFELL